MVRTDKLYDNPRSKKLRDEQKEAKKGDVEKFDDEEFQSVGEKWLNKDDSIGSDVDPDELEAKITKPDGKNKTIKSGGGWDEIRVKDSEGGRRREYFKRKPEKPVS